MMRKLAPLGTFFLFLLAAASAHAQTQVSELVVTAPAKGATLATLTTSIVGVVNGAVIPLMYALAFLFLIAGLVRYFFIESGDEGREKGKQMALYGVIGLAVIFCVWGLVNILLATLNSVAGV